MKTRKSVIDTLQTQPMNSSDTNIRKMLSSCWTKKGDILSHDHGRVYEQKLQEMHDKKMLGGKRKSKLRQSITHILGRKPTKIMHTRSYNSFAHTKRK